MVLCLIPARYSSTRLPGKPLLKINGVSIIARVYQQVIQCRLIDRIIVLTDDVRIQSEIIHIGGESEIVSDTCLNGTERIIKYLKTKNYTDDIIVNVQGDEPYINPFYIDRCIENYNMKKDIPDFKCSTLHYCLENNSGLADRSIGKLVLDRWSNIMYCSRNIIPGTKTQDINSKVHYYGHIGIFVFDREYLMNEYLGSSIYQLSEDIEWLKILEDGYKINSVEVDNPEISVDTPEDYAYLVKKYSCL